MNFTLKLKKSTNPLFIQKDGTINHYPTNQPLIFDSVNEIAEAFVKKTLIFDNCLDMNDVIVSEYDIVALANKSQIAMSLVQEEDAEYKLVSTDDIFSFITQKRAANLYLKSGKKDLKDPVIENLYILATQNDYEGVFKVGDILVPCSDYSGRIFTHKRYEVIDDIDIEKLWNNLDVDIDSKHYYPVVEI